MRPRILGLSGYARSGKDTVAGFLTDYGYVSRSFAAPLKDAVYFLDPIIYADENMSIRVQAMVDAHGWDVVKVQFPEARRLLQYMGTEVGRTLFGDDFWVDAAMKRIPPDQLTVFTDCRFPNEARAVKRLGGEVWRIERPGVGPVSDHPSETALDDWGFDVVIGNGASLDTLRDKVRRLMAVREP